MDTLILVFYPFSNIYTPENVGTCKQVQTYYNVNNMLGYSKLP